MPKAAPDATLDQMLDYIADNGGVLHVCTDEPANYAGISAVELGTYALTVGAGNGDYTKANGDVSGRKLTVGAQSEAGTDGDIDTTGEADHIVLSDGVDTLVYVTTATAQTLTAGGTFDTNAWDIELADPA